jgi:eukaryotic-like serine/threonine-protein kinase
VFLDFSKDTDGIQLRIPVKQPGYFFMGIHDYQLLSRLHSGGMGDVWLGKRHPDKEAVAIKVGHADAVVRSFAQQSLSNEAKLLEKMNNPHVVSLVEWLGPPLKRHALIQSYHHGETVAHLSEKGSAFQQEARLALVMRIAGDVLDGLGHFQMKFPGWCHADITPQNIVVGVDGTSTLIDFGLARSVGCYPDLQGTYAYLAPEIVEQQQWTAASDLFSWAVIIWELIEQKRLFLGNNLSHTLHLISQGFVPFSSTKHPDFRILYEVVEACLNPDPLSRPQRALDVSSLLQSVRSEKREVVGQWVRQQAADQLQQREKTLGW